MFLLPHVLYLFRKLPLPLLLVGIAKLQHSLNFFIWAARKLRLKTSILRTMAADLGAPNIKRYYKAVILDQVKQWWFLHPLTSWLQIESTTVPCTPHLLLAATWMNFHTPYLPMIKAITTIWKAITQTSMGYIWMPSDYYHSSPCNSYLQTYRFNTGFYQESRQLETYFTKKT